VTSPAPAIRCRGAFKRTRLAATPARQRIPG